MRTTYRLGLRPGVVAVLSRRREAAGNMPYLIVAGFSIGTSHHPRPGRGVARLRIAFMLATRTHRLWLSSSTGAVSLETESFRAGRDEVWTSGVCDQSKGGCRAEDAGRI
jgi:hypothetical protein